MKGLGLNLIQVRSLFFLRSRTIIGSAILCLLSLAFSCKFRPNVQGRGEPTLQGVWLQHSIANKEKLLNYTTHWFKFTCDSFYVDFVTHAKVNYYQDDCFNGGVWKEYAKGVYVFRNDTLFLQGDFTKSNYKQKISGCYRNGRYLANFIVAKPTDSLLVFENVNDKTKIKLALQQTIECVPKEL